MFQAEVIVMLKPGVLDSQGKAVAGGLSALGYQGVTDVRVGKLIQIQLSATSKADAERQIEEMGRRLLANLVIEDFRCTVTEV